MHTFLIGISGGEIIVVFLFVLIFFGADKIPGVARTMGRTLRQIKDATGDIQREIQDSANQVRDKVSKTMDEAKETFDPKDQDGTENRGGGRGTEPGKGKNSKSV